MSEKQRFTAQEKRIFAGCFICYMLCYVARMNLAGALPHVTQAFSLTDAQAGLIQTVFAVVYAAGQLITSAPGVMSLLVFWALLFAIFSLDAAMPIGRY